MYINLFSHKQLALTKRYLLILCVFLISGGAYALFREILLVDAIRTGWALSSALILISGILLYFFSNNQLDTKEAYFSMNPERIKYRLALFSKEHVIHWKDINSIEISTQTIVYNLTTGLQIKMRLGNIQQPEVMLHVSRSIHLAALEKGVTINGIKSQQQTSVA